MEKADVLVRRSNDEEQTYWVDVRTPSGDVLHDGGKYVYPWDDALSHAQVLQHSYEQNGYDVEIVMDGYVWKMF